MFLLDDTYTHTCKIHEQLYARFPQLWDAGEVEVGIDPSLLNGTKVCMWRIGGRENANSDVYNFLYVALAGSIVTPFGDIVCNTSDFTINTRPVDIKIYPSNVDTGGMHRIYYRISHKT